MKISPACFFSQSACFFYRDKEEDEGIPSESEEEKKVLDTKARELKGKNEKNGHHLIFLVS